MKSKGIFFLCLAANFLNAKVLSPNTNLTAREEQIIAATKPGATPHFNGAMVVGVRAGTPFLHSLAVSGERPMSFGAENLPPGLALDSKNGIITGSLAQAGEYRFNPNSEVADGGGLAEAKPECARPRAQPLASYQRRNIFQPPPIPRCCARGRAHSVPPNSKIAADKTAEPPRCEYFSA